jgi:DNA invertase Pin-like site-specific DNA recombinase
MIMNESVVTMSEPAGIFQRVSTGGQDEANQLPDLVKWCDGHDYTYKLDGPHHYVLHGKSASKGKQDKALNQVIRDMQDGKITVLVVWQSSRIERRGAYSAFDLARRVREAGGRIEYVQDEYLNAANEMSDVMLALAATKDRQKSQDISKQVIASQAAKRAAGSAVGRAAWGYEIICAVCDRRPVRPDCKSHRKIFRPTADGRKYIPVIFARVIGGESLVSIAAWLTAEGVPTTTGGIWSEGYLCQRLIKNPVYYGARRNAGELVTEELVGATTWQEANAAVVTRARPGRGASTREKALLNPICGQCYGKPREGCLDGISPMYQTGDYYRCYGHGAQRKGCGFMILMSELDEIVTESMLGNQQPHSERVFIAGDDQSDEIAKLRERGAELFRTGDYAAAAECATQATELESAPRVRPHWEDRVTDQTEAEYFAGMDLGQRREYLMSHRIFAGESVEIAPRDYETAYRAA